MITIPAIDPDSDALTAALAYAAAGLYVLPVARGSKHPGSIVGKEWPILSSCDPKVIASWFAGTDYGVAIHCGRSGIVVLDVDNPGDVPHVLADAFRDYAPPFHSSRVNVPRKGHYLFAMPPGRTIGNSNGSLGSAWGEVRGLNGVIIVAPSVHEDAINGGEYRWQRVGAVPVLPDSLATLLPDVVQRPAAAGEAISALRGAAIPGEPCRRVSGALSAACGALRGTRTGSRHERMVSATFELTALAREAHRGVPGALVELRRTFIGAVADRSTPDEAAGEFDRTEAGAWAIAAAKPASNECDCDGYDGLDLVPVPNSRDLPLAQGAVTVTAIVAPSSDQPVSTWRPLDLGPYVRGEIKQPQPTVGLERVDGVRFLYPGLEHACIGESESGKSWFALGCVAAELEAGHPVVYVHFEESNPTDSIKRLILLGVSITRITAGFRFIAPSERITPEVIEWLTDVPPSLVILDGQNEAMALHDQDIMAAAGVAAYRRVLVKPFTRVDATVLSLDHVVKDSDRNGNGYALGSAHKMNGLSGAGILLENREPFGQGRRGRSSVFVVKDRPGSLRRSGVPTKVPRKFHLGEMVVDSESGFSLNVWAPRDDDESIDRPAQSTDDDKVYAAVLRLLSRGIATSIRKVRAEVPINGVKVDAALERLVVAGRLDEERGERGARIFKPTVFESHDH